MKAILSLIVTTLAAQLNSASAAAEADKGCGEEPPCIAEGKACKSAEDDCCAGMGCFGFNFYKSCQYIPECLPEWYDCDNGVSCCSGIEIGGEEWNLVCADKGDGSGKKECQKSEITTRTTDLPDEDERPPPEDPSPNLNTLKQDPVQTREFCVSGDPHIDTFDGLEWDCMGHGEFVIMKSQATRREVQGRFMQMQNAPFTSTTGIVIQDEGDVPLVQFSIPMTGDGASHTMSGTWQDWWSHDHSEQPFTCELQMFVDGQQVDMYHYVSEHFTLDIYHNRYLQLRFTESEFRIHLNIDYFHGCMFGTCFHVPTTDDSIGLLGSPDGNPLNDWMDRSGNSVGPPTTDENALRWESEISHAYCTEHWCLRDRVESLFTYNEVGFLFGSFQRCDLPVSTMLAEHVIEGVTPEVEEACKGDMDCYMDVIIGGNLEAAVAQLRMREDALPATCNLANGECSVADCCDGLICLDRGFEGKICVTEIDDNFCMPGTGNCAKYQCCNGAPCVDAPNGHKRCDPPHECNLMTAPCSSSDECCDDMACVGPDGDKTCMLAGEAADGSVCLLDETACDGMNTPCCEGSCLMDTDGIKRCSAATCRAKEETCDDTLPCCEGTSCQFWVDRHLCLTTPTCIANYGDCDDSIGCCSTLYSCQTVTGGPMDGKKKCMVTGAPSP